MPAYLTKSNQTNPKPWWTLPAIDYQIADLLQRHTTSQLQPQSLTVASPTPCLFFSLPPSR